jgi:hypothetical protein
MKKLLPIFIVLFSFFFYTFGYAQSRFSHEVGASFGIASFQTDFGESNDFASANASTFSVGFAHYLKFFGSQYSWRSGSSFFSEHFKLKTEFNYMLNTRVEHEGSYVIGSGETATKLRAMTGEIKMYNIGTNLEYYFLELEDYSSFYKSSGTLNPFISAGVHYSFYDPDIKVNEVTLEGQSEPYTGLIDKWQTGAIYLEKGNTFGVSAGAGIRYSIDTFDLVLDGRYQYFFSDQVDGLDAPVDPGNKNNDTVIFVNVGIVYVFGKY